MPTEQTYLTILQKQEAETATPWGQGPAFACSIQFQGHGAEPGKSSGSSRVRPGVRVTVAGEEEVRPSERFRGPLAPSP